MSSFFRQLPRKIILFSFCIGLLNLPAPVFAGEILKIGGTGTSLGAMKLIAAAFKKVHPEIQAEIMPSVGSSGAIRAVSQGALDMGLISRPLDRDELHLGLSVSAYAKTPFVFVVNRNVPVSGLTSTEIIKIYKGEMRIWPNGERIRLILRPASDADTQFAKTISPEMSSAVDAASARQGMLMALTNQECHDIIVHTPGSIGFSSLAQVITDKQPMKVLSLNGVVPSLQSINDGSYPLVRTLSLITKSSMPTQLRRFIDFLRSPEGGRILRQSGNIPVAYGNE